MITTTESLNKNLETLLVIFFNVELSDDGNFEVISSFRESKFLEIKQEYYDLTVENLTKKYKIKFFKDSSIKIVSKILNDKNLSLDTYRSFIYEEIISRIIRIDADFNLDEEIALAMFMLRGSPDINRGFYSVDIKDASEKYFESIYKILLSTDELLSRLNLNFRELQPEYINRIAKRNTQIRINLKFFFDNVISKNPELNKYKYLLLLSNIENLGDSRKFDSFEKRIVLYKSAVIGRELNEDEINNIRKDLDFDRLEFKKETGKKQDRNQKIVSYAREILLDECVGCKNLYDIKIRSFKMPRNDRYYFEINHVLPFSNGVNSVDVLDNLVKLCPTCHRALTPGRAYPEYQKEIIEKMIESRVEVKQFIKYQAIKNKTEDLTEFIFSSLK